MKKSCGKTSLFALSYSILALTGIISYFFYVERLHHRIFVLFWFVTFLIIAYYICTEHKSFNIGFPISLLSLLVTFCLFTYIGCWISDTEKYQEQKRTIQTDVRDFYQSVSEDKKHLYITDNATDLSTYSYDVFRSYPEGYLDNLAYFGYWLTNSPIEHRILNQYQVTNPYTACLENKNIYIIDNTTIDQKLIYIREHYNSEAQLHLIENRNGFNIYMIE